MEGVEPSTTERLSPAVEADKPTAEAFDVDDLDLFLDDFINACAAPPSEAQSSEVPDNSEPVRAGDDQVPMDVDESAAAPAAQDKETTPAPHALVDPDATESPESIGGPDPPANVPSPSTSPEPEGPRRIIIIEELDTPLIRRQKNAEKRAARDAKKRAAAAAARGLSPLTPVPSSGPVAGPSRLPPAAPLRPIDDDDSSDLTNLSGEETETDSPRPKKALPLRPPPPPEPVSVVRRRVPKPIDPTEPGVIVLKPGERVEGGTLGTLFLLLHVAGLLTPHPARSMGEDGKLPVVAGCRLRTGRSGNPGERAGVCTRDSTSRDRARAFLREEAEEQLVRLRADTVNGVANHCRVQGLAFGEQHPVLGRG